MLAENTAALEMLQAAYKPAQVHEPNKVPENPVTPYAIVTVSSGAAGNHRGGTHGSKGYRIAVQCVGKTTSEIGKVIDATEAAFLDQHLEVPGFDTSPCMSEVGANVVRDPDGGGGLYCLLTFTFTSFPIPATEESP